MRPPAECPWNGCGGPGGSCLPAQPERKPITAPLPTMGGLPGVDGDQLSKRAKHSDAVMTGIFVTKFKMGQIDAEDLEQMAADATRAERCSAAKKVLVCLRDDADHCH